MSENNEKKTLKELIEEFDKSISEFSADENDLDIDAAIEKYKHGIKLADEIKLRLETAKNKIKELK